MICKSLNYTLMFVIVGITAIASTVISSIAFESFAYFEIFYFVCIALSILTLLTTHRIRGHILAGILLYNLGYLVNCLFWTINYQSGVGLILNIILTVEIFLSGLAFVHAFFNAKYGKGLSIISSVMLIIMTLVVVIYSLATKFTSSDPLYVACIIIQNLSLLSTIMLPLAQIKFVKAKTDEK